MYLFGMLDVRKGSHVGEIVFVIFSGETCRVSVNFLFCHL